MLGKLRGSIRKYGLPPGTPVSTDDSAQEHATIDIIDYTTDSLLEKKNVLPEECAAYRDKSSVTWIDVIGIGDIDTLQKLGGIFDIHPLILEDIAHTSQRPKTEIFGQHVFTVTRLITLDGDTGEASVEQVGILTGPSYVITFQERHGDVFDPVRERIRTSSGRIRTSGADYLLYALIDMTVDSYFFVLEILNDITEELEEEILGPGTPEAVFRIHRLKRTAIILRKGIWPMRDVITGLRSDVSPLIGESIDIYLRDALDHINRVIESLELLRDMISGLIDLNMANAGNRMNEIMKILSLIGTIFIPLTFIAGIYGMNFANMPELGWEWGYFAALALMLVTGIGMVIFFKSRKWL